eukprot:4862795-Amphidinium_carterae.1
MVQQMQRWLAAMTMAVQAWLPSAGTRRFEYVRLARRGHAQADLMARHPSSVQVAGVGLCPISEGCSGRPRAPLCCCLTGQAERRAVVPQLGQHALSECHHPSGQLYRPLLPAARVPHVNRGAPIAD